MAKFALAALFLAGASAIAWADQTATLPDGRQVLLKENGTYEIQASGNSGSGGDAYTDLNLVDVKVDMKELENQRIRTSGKGMLVGNMFILTEASTAIDSNGVMVDISKLPREMRKWVVTNCAQGGCRATIEGEVRSDISGFMPGILAHSVKPN
ncbi:hypothetical protein [Hyphomicrobium facile]|uniref:Uncharacterized protein n=1 Tax=Hyphomicrobium facile TaxID=51670 RepID=A0A1I7MXJ6_9HYPH|nr:hypothetical protein [Hyphomicrobium facile]SFV27098.1 hypothetical protein SAMN04488557_0677 [Hyphomicrobium facile]